MSLGNHLPILTENIQSIALAVSNNKQYVATACKATSAAHAVVRLYDTQTWQLFGQPLAGHNLTVTQIAFSPDDTLVLSVSRDRTWRLFEQSEGSSDPTCSVTLTIRWAYREDRRLCTGCSGQVPWSDHLGLRLGT